MKEMEILAAKMMSFEALQHFIDEHGFDVYALYEKGYVVTENEQIISCFQLEHVENKAYWLKQLYVMQDEVMKLPRILAYILHFAEQLEMEIIYAHSHQPVTDLLFQAFHFSLNQSPTESLRQSKNKGNWWTYKICS